MTSRVGSYLLFETIGEGAFGKVKLAVDENTGEQVAVKIMDKEIIHASDMTMNVRREIAIMKALKHPNIVNMRQVLSSSNKLYIIMDLVTGGELFTKILNEGALPEDVARKYFQQLVDGVEYCHRKGVSHRDLKPENLLLDEVTGALKITDFGLSAMKGVSTTSELLHTQCGSPNYCAPEIIAGPKQGYNGAKADTWSCGIILFALVAGYLPFYDEDTKNLYKQIQKDPIKFPRKGFPEGPKEICRLLLHKRADKRASLSEIKKHPWFLVNYEPAMDIDDNIPRTNVVVNVKTQKIMNGMDEQKDNSSSSNDEESAAAATNSHPRNHSSQHSVSQHSASQHSSMGRTDSSAKYPGKSDDSSVDDTTYSHSQSRDRDRDHIINHNAINHDIDEEDANYVPDDTDSNGDDSDQERNQSRVHGHGSAQTNMDQYEDAASTVASEEQEYHHHNHRQKSIPVDDVIDPPEAAKIQNIMKKKTQEHLQNAHIFPPDLESKMEQGVQNYRKTFSVGRGGLARTKSFASVMHNKGGNRTPEMELVHRAKEVSAIWYVIFVDALHGERAENSPQITDLEVYTFHSLMDFWVKRVQKVRNSGYKGEDWWDINLPVSSEEVKHLKKILALLEITQAETDALELGTPEQSVQANLGNSPQARSNESLPSNDGSSRRFPDVTDPDTPQRERTRKPKIDKRGTSMPSGEIKRRGSNLAQAFSKLSFSRHESISADPFKHDSPSGFEQSSQTSIPTSAPKKGEDLYGDSSKSSAGLGKLFALKRTLPSIETNLNPEDAIRKLGTLLTNNGARVMRKRGELKMKCEVPVPNTKVPLLISITFNERHGAGTHIEFKRGRKDESKVDARYLQSYVATICDKYST